MVGIPLDPEEIARFQKWQKERQKIFEGLRDPDKIDEQISELASSITSCYAFWLPEAFSGEAVFEIEGEVGTILTQIVRTFAPGVLGEEST